jgi:hypothetical protein
MKNKKKNADLDHASEDYKVTFKKLLFKKVTSKRAHLAELKLRFGEGHANKIRNKHQNGLAPARTTIIFM